ncbi:hypothetical protein CNR22_17060 [Sphingobacteriaceae bacterium]|nr:hypothetical protein CNR22_17060 [Sphingobacteriaceae bacterium]
MNELSLWQRYHHRLSTCLQLLLLFQALYICFEPPNLQDMKQTLLAITFACLFTFSSKSQFNYSSIWVAYPPGYELTSGFATKQKPGYFWIGYMPTVQNIQTTWYINKNFSILGAGPSSMSVSYKVFDASACIPGAPLSQVLTGNGVSAIETNGANGFRYAIAGSYDKACYFTAIDTAGNVLAAVSYPFPYLPTGLYPAPSKPLIVESDTPGEFYICGCFESKIYVLKVNSAGAILWSSFYALGLGVDAKDIMADPYMPGHFIVVGQTTTLLLDKQGVFMRLNGMTGNVIMTKTFGDYGIQEEFGTVVEAHAATTSGGAGFILGGQRHFLNASEKPWILKISPQGTIVWSYLPLTSAGTRGAVVDVTERLNTFNNYEYYALLDSDAGLHVLKLDYSGQPFPTSSPNALHNEFIYNLSSSLPPKAASISYIDNAASNSNAGIQVFGTSSHWPGFSSSYVVSAYFNGEINCYPTLTTMQGMGQGSLVSYNALVTRFGSFAACTNFQVQSFIIGAGINFPCSGFLSSGSNQRSISATSDLPENKMENFSVFPNPTQHKATLNYSASDNSKTTIALYNLVGELIWNKTLEIATAGTFQEEIDFNALNIQKGIYIAICNSNGKNYKQKIVYTN